MYAGTGYAHCSLSETNAYHIHAHRSTQFIHAKPHRVCKNKNRTGIQTCPVQKYNHTYYTQRHTTYLYTQHEWTHSLDVITETPYPLQPHITYTNTHGHKRCISVVYFMYLFLGFTLRQAFPKIYSITFQSLQQPPRQVLLSCPMYR